MAISAGKIVAYLELDTTKFKSGFKEAINDIRVWGDQTQTVGNRWSALASGIGKVGSELTKNVTVPLLAIGTASVKVTANFEKNMSAVKAVSGATGSEFESLKKKAIDLGASTVFSASEVSEAMIDMAKAGWSSQQIMSGMEGVLNAASASGENLATVSTIIADAITGFGLAASDATRVADLLAQSANAGTIDITDLGESFKYISPIAKTMGFSIEDVTTALTALSTAGIKGSQAGTSLRTMFARMVKPTDAVKAAMEQLGIVLTNSDGSFKDLNTILSEMRGTFSNLTPEQQTYYATVLAGQEGMSGLVSILGMTQEEYDKISESMKNAGGVAKETAEEMTNNLSGSVTLLKSAFEGAGIAIGKNLTPIIKDIADWVNKLVTKFNKLSDEEQQQIVKVGAIVAALGPLLMILSKLMTATMNVGTGFVKLYGHLDSGIKKFSNFIKAGGDGVSVFEKLKTGISKVWSVTGLCTAAIGFLTVAITTDIIKRKERIDELAKESDSEQWLTDKINEETEARKQSQEAVSSAIESAQQEADATRNLAGKLSEVVDENGRVKEGKEAYAQFIVGQLSEALGQEITIVDGQIQGYDELNGTIEETIKKKQALAIQESLGDEYYKALSKQSGAVVNYTTKLNEYNSTVAEGNDLKRRYNELAKGYGGMMGQNITELADLNTQIEANTEKQKEQAEKVSDARENMEYYNATITNYENLVEAIASGSSDAIQDALNRINNNFMTAGDATRDGLVKQADDLKANYETLAQELANGNQNVTQQMVDDAKSLMEKANGELNTKTEELKQNLIEKFKEIGIEMPNAMAQSLAEKSDDVQQAVLNTLAHVQNGVVIAEPELSALFGNVGIECPESMIHELSNAAPDVQKQAIDLLFELQNAEGSKRQEILRQYQNLGLNVDSSLAGGITSNTKPVTDAGGSVGKSGWEAIKEAMKGTVPSPSVSDNTVSSADDVGRRARSALGSWFKDSIIATIQERISGGSNGHHANGLDYVPFNNYRAVLHEGERVLTKQENEEYSRNNVNNSGDVFNFYNTKPTPYEYAKQMKRAKRSLLYGF